MKTRTGLIAVWCAAVLSGCATTLPGGGGFTDATAPIGQREYAVVGPAEAAVMSTIFLKQFGSPDIAKARDMAAASAGGDELVGVVWEEEYRNYLLFQKLGVTVRGTAIKFTDGQAIREVRRVVQAPTLPVKRNHGITFGFGAFSSERAYRAYDRRTGRYTRRTSDYGRGWSIAYKPRQQDKQRYFAPSVAVTSLEDLTSIAAMGNVVVALDEYVPGPLAPYAEAGLGYTPTVWRNSEVLDWARFGWNAGVGATLPISPGLVLDISASRQASIGGFGTYWSSDEGFYRSYQGSDLTSDPHFWRFGVGLVLLR